MFHLAGLKTKKTVTNWSSLRVSQKMLSCDPPTPVMSLLPRHKSSSSDGESLSCYSYLSGCLNSDAGADFLILLSVAVGSNVNWVSPFTERRMLSIVNNNFSRSGLNSACLSVLSEQASAATFCPRRRGTDRKWDGPPSASKSMKPRSEEKPKNPWSLRYLYKSQEDKLFHGISHGFKE